MFHVVKNMGSMVKVGKLLFHEQMGLLHTILSVFSTSSRLRKDLLNFSAGGGCEHHVLHAYLFGLFCHVV